MSWSPQQDEALKAVNRWLKDGKAQVFRLFGYAGTGKTTLSADPERVLIGMQLVVTGLLFWRHRSNIRNLIEGSEDRLTDKPEDVS